MKLLSNQPIKHKFITIVLIISAVSLTMNEIIDYYLEKNRTIEITIENTLLDCRLISDYCVVPLVFDDESAANKILENLNSKPSIQKAWLFDKDSNLFASYGKSKIDEKFLSLLRTQTHLITENSIYVKSPVNYNNTHYGYLYIESITDINTINRDRILFSIIIGLGMLIIAFTLSSYFQRYITHPIVKLTKFTEALSKNQDYKQQIEKIHDDEVGQLYDEFNKMLTVISDANEKLGQDQLMLEKLVEKRTAALEKTNEKLTNAKNEAEKANHIKSEFLSNMSHELRTPLNGIMGYAQILKSMGNLDSNQIEQIDIIHSSGKHLLSLINEILDYSKIEANKLKLTETDFCFTDLIRHVINIIRIRAEEKDLLLDFYKQTEIPEFVKGDEVKIRQILINLLNNAVKYTKTGKITLRIAFNNKEKHNLRIEIEDTGVGIAKDHLGKIFDPFTQVNNQIKFIEGTGLGLAITLRLVELMDGTLHVESIVNKGTLFTIKLNLPITNEVAVNTGYAHYIKGYKGKTIKVLAVDDNLTNLSFLISSLKPIGFEIITAQNGEEAVEEYKRYKPDIILMDLVMPVMNGLEAIKEIKKLPDYKDVKIIGVTASVIERDERVNFIANCNAHIDKPIDLNQLFDIIHSLTEIKWIIDDKLPLNKKRPEYTIKKEDALTPSKETLNRFIELAEIGDFDAIKIITDNLLKTSKNYYHFTKQINDYSERYDSERLTAFIQSLKH